MENANVCRCCGKTLKQGRNKCEYCGMVRLVALDESGSDYAERSAREYRTTLLQELKNISIKCYVFEWDEAKHGLVKQGERIEKLADGIQCDERLYWSNTRFGQSSAGKQINLSFIYDYFGQKKQVVCTIIPQETKDFWQIGLMIDKRLQLKVCLGTKNKYAVQEGIPLDLKR